MSFSIHRVKTALERYKHDVARGVEIGLIDPELAKNIQDAEDETEVLIEIDGLQNEIDVGQEELADTIEAAVLCLEAAIKASTVKGESS